MTPSITIYDIAKEANVSVATVSRVLNGTAPVKASTKEKILKIIETHQFQPNALARSLLKKETGIIAIILPDITNPFFPEVFLAAENEAREKGYTLILCNTEGDFGNESQYLSILREKRVDGIIFMGGRINLSQCPPELAQEIIDFSKYVPIVLVNGNIPNGNFHRVYTDEVLGAELATQHLIDLGHREIAFLGGLKEMKTTLSKVKAYRKVLEKNQIEYRADRVLLGDYSINSGRELMKKLLESKDRPTAVFCVNDFTAIGAIKTIFEYDLRIPEDISILGFDDTPLASAIIPELTTVSQQTYQLGKSSVEQLHKMIAKEQVKKQFVLKPELIIRKSTGSANIF